MPYPTDCINIHQPSFTLEVLIKFQIKLNYGLYRYNKLLKIMTYQQSLHLKLTNGELLIEMTMKSICAVRAVFMSSDLEAQK